MQEGGGGGGRNKKVGNKCHFALCVSTPFECKINLVKFVFLSSYEELMHLVFVLLVHVGTVQHAGLLHRRFIVCSLC